MSSEFAQSFLESADWNLEQAMELYLGGGVVPAGNTTTTRPMDSDDDVKMLEGDEEDEYDGGRGVAAGTYSRGGFSSSSGVATPGMFDRGGEEPLREDRGEDGMTVAEFAEMHGVDLETAAAMKQAMGGAGAGASSDGVRAPIQQKRARLFGSPQQLSHVEGGIRGLQMGGAYEASLRASRDVFMGGVGMAAGLADQYLAANETSSRAMMFAPPRALLFKGSFDDALNAAKSSQKWLMVNIQNQSEFQSLVLNRDLWSNDVIQNSVQDSFVFWQQEHNTTEAQRFLALYNPGSSALPHVCLIDPRTGERVQILKLKKTEDDLRMAFFEQLTLFLEKNSMETTTRARMPTPTAQVKASLPPPITTIAPRREDDDELAAAIAASLRQETPAAAANTSSVKPAISEKAAAPAWKPVSAEPEVGNPSSTTIRFKFPDSSTEKRRFLKSDIVSSLFSFVASHAKGQTLGNDFDLVTSDRPSRSMQEKLTESLAEADACNQMLIVRLAEA